MNTIVSDVPCLALFRLSMQDQSKCVSVCVSVFACASLCGTVLLGTLLINKPLKQRLITH